ncbi:unnamed protein product, partial [Symbiodinium pilosum]
MARQGRTCAVELLAWKKHRVCTDTRGNMFFLVFISKLRPTRVEDMMRKFVSRDPLAMQDADVQAWVSLCFATSVAEAEHALEQLRVYDPRACSFNWTRAVRMFSDLRLVVLGPNTQRMWTLRNVTDPSEDGNVHHLGLCFLCAHAVLHGPCEHLYLALLALGRFQFTYASRSAQSGLSGLGTSAAHASQADPAEGADEANADGEADPVSDPILDQVLREAGLLHYRHMFASQQISLPVILEMSFADLRHFFKMSPAESYRLNTCAQNVPSSTPD